MPVELRMVGGQAVAVKSRSGEEAGAALERELALLSSLDVEGIVRPADDELTDDGALLLEAAGAGTLANTRPTPEQARTLGAQLATTVAALHRAGVTHGAIEASHVLWSPGRPPVLCGFGEASTDGAPADDVAALGRLLRSLLPDDDPGAAELDRPVSDLARLAAILAPPTETHPRLPRAAPRASTSTRLPRQATIVAAGVLGVVVAVVFAVVVVPRLPGGGGSSDVAADQVSPTTAAPPAVDPAPVATPAPTVPAPTTTDALVWPEPEPEPTCPAVDPGSLGTADVDGDGCEEAVDRQGTVVEAGGQRWELGGPGDHVVLGDWWCEGTLTPALVTATDGAVHLFDGWPVDGPATVTATAVVGPAVDVRVAAGDGCDVVVVELPDGTEQEVTA